MVAGRSFSFFDYLLWLVGCGNWLYFIPVLLMCKMLFRLPVHPSIWMILSLISVLLSQYQLIPYNSIFNHYLNAFNFAIYFGVGRLIRAYYGDSDIVLKNRAAVIALALLIVTFPWTKSYFSISGVIIGFSGTVILYFLSGRLNCQLLKQIGENSFVIYFLHMQIGGMIANRLTFVHNTPFEWVKVVVAFSIVALLVEIFKRLLLKIYAHQVLRYLGYR